MTDLLIVLVASFLVIAASTMFAPRLGLASPLLLVALGVAASFVPLFAGVQFEPEWILEGILPPLLYSSAVSMPAMNFRREFSAISGLSVLLVVATSLVLGLFFMWVLPGLGFAWGAALGAIVSPTDAVATSIVKGTSVSQRVIALLDGESLLNDASALVLLRTAIVAVASAFSFWGAVGTFAYSVVVAVAIGLVVGWLNLAVRGRVTDPTVNTLISFTVPFLASVPAEAAQASGLVAAVVAGLVTGVRAPRVLPPQSRLSDTQNWRLIELVLEGVVFLTMGLELKSIVMHVEQDHSGVGVAVLIAVGALLLTIVVRLIYVVPLLLSLRHRTRRRGRMQDRLQDMQQNMGTPEGKQRTQERINARGRRVTDRDMERFSTRITRMLADIDYFTREPMGWREGVAIVWAGMRGAVTVAAAQTLPENTPQRSVLILVAFVVAALSLLLQGGTIGPLLKAIAPKPASAGASGDAGSDDGPDPVADEEWSRLMHLMRDSGMTVPRPDTPAPAERTIESMRAERDYRLAVIAAQRSALLDARDNGTFDADLLANALANLDADQMAMELRGKRR